MLTFRNTLAENTESVTALNGRRKLVELCETRWTARANALTTFIQAFDVVIESLENAEADGDPKARQLRCSILKFDFIIVLVSTERILQYTVALSNSLQKVNISLVIAFKEATNLMSILRSMREYDDKWDELYNTSVAMASTYDIVPMMPRVKGRQRLIRHSTGSGMHIYHLWIT